ncbi:MAG TPA: hypothetical protein VH639_24800 [Bryobacteraceae bacterium]
MHRVTESQRGNGIADGGSLHGANGGDRVDAWNTRIQRARIHLKDHPKPTTSSVSFENFSLIDALSSTR